MAEGGGVELRNKFSEAYHPAKTSDPGFLVSEKSIFLIYKWRYNFDSRRATTANKPVVKHVTVNSDPPPPTTLAAQVGALPWKANYSEILQGGGIILSIPAARRSEPFSFQKAHTNGENARPLFRRLELRVGRLRFGNDFRGRNDPGTPEAEEDFFYFWNKTLEFSPRLQLLSFVSFLV